MPHPPRQRAALAFIFVTVTLDILAFGVTIPVLPRLIEQIVGGDMATAAKWLGATSTAFALMQFLFNPIQGALSDRFGRRPVILLSNLGLGIDFAVMALVNTIPLLMLARLVSGMTAASYSTANAYIADITPAHKRAASFGMLGAAFGIGFVLGPLLGGALGSISLRLPFWVSAGLAVANFLYGWLVLPESLPVERRSPRFDWTHANPIGSLLLLKRYPQVFGLAFVVFLSNVAHYALPSTFVLYSDYRFGWGSLQVGCMLAAMGVCSGIVQAWMVGKLTPRFGERALVLAGVLFGIAGFLVMGLSTNSTLFVSCIPLLALWGLGGPTEQAIMTHQVDPQEQGRLQGAITSLASVAGIFAPALHTQVFAAAVGVYAAWHLPGAAFLLSAGLMVIAWIVAYRVTTDLPAHIPAPAAMDAE